MRRFLLPAAAVIVLLGVLLGYWLFMERVQPEDAAAEPQDPLVEAALLAIKGISLIQGEQGFEFWRLRAEWAALSQQDGDIEVREPRVRYTLGEQPSEDYVYAASESGRVTNGQAELTMWGNVRLTRGDELITGPEMIFRTQDRTVRFTRGARIQRPRLDGRFLELLWDMDKNSIEGHTVDLVFEGREPGPGGMPDGNPERTAPDDGPAAPIEETEPGTLTPF